MISMRSAFLLALASSASLLPAAAFAQTEAPPADETATSDDSGLTDIIVTARRREEKLQDVPIAVTAFTDEALEQKASPIAPHSPITRLRCSRSAAVIRASSPISRCAAKARRSDRRPASSIISPKCRTA
jgi:hypothetical protein